MIVAICGIKYTPLHLNGTDYVVENDTVMGNNNNNNNK